jgi:hypothetical protein
MAEPFGEKSRPHSRRAPAFDLSAMDGQSSLYQTPSPAAQSWYSSFLPRLPVRLLERIHKTYGGKQLTIVGISQNEKQDTASFLKKYGITFPILLDDTKTYPASNAYGLTNVPTSFWISTDSKIEISSVGWSRQDFEQMASQAAAATASVPLPIFQPKETIADFRAG